MADQNRNVQAGTMKMGTVPENTVVTKKKGRFSVLEAAQSNDVDTNNTSNAAGPIHRSSPNRHLRSKSALPTTISPPKRTIIQGDGQVAITRSNSFPLNDASKTAESPSAIPPSVQKKGRFIISSSDPAVMTQPNRVENISQQQRGKPTQQQTLMQPTQTPQIVRINQARLPIAPSTSTSAQSTQSTQSTSKTTSMGSHSSSSVSSPSDRPPATGTSMTNTARLASAPSGMGKTFHFLEQMKQEVTDADKLIKSLQSDNRFLVRLFVFSSYILLN